MTSSLIHIGTIRGAHGVKGLVRIAVFADDISLFNFEPTYKITLKNKHKGNVWLAEIIGITNKEDADALKTVKLYCDRTNFSDVDDDEIYHVDLIGRTCVDEDGNIIGTVASVDNFGAGDLLDIKPPSGENFYLSYDEKTVLNVDEKITVAIPSIL